MRRRFFVVVWLTALWIVLWRDLSAANLASGVAVAVAVMGRSIHPRGGHVRHRLRPLALLRFVAFFGWKLLEANVVVAREVVTPRNVIHTGIVAVPLAGYSDLVVTAVANAVSLTPGTLTLEVRREPHPVLYVHVLHLHDVERARADVVRMAEMAGAAVVAVPTEPTSPSPSPSDGVDR